MQGQNIKKKYFQKIYLATYSSSEICAKFPHLDSTVNPNGPLHRLGLAPGAWAPSNPAIGVALPSMQLRLVGHGLVLASGTTHSGGGLAESTTSRRKIPSQVISQP